jgi:hypothetical protein
VLFHRDFNKTKASGKRRLWLERVPATSLLGSRFRFRVLPAEALDAARRIHQLLFAGEKWMTGGADFDVDVAFVSGAGGEVVSARAHDPDFVIVWVNPLLWHDAMNLSLQSLNFIRDRTGLAITGL